MRNLPAGSARENSGSKAALDSAFSAAVTAAFNLRTSIRRRLSVRGWSPEAEFSARLVREAPSVEHLWLAEQAERRCWRD
jgi:hypothetical protein